MPTDTEPFKTGAPFREEFVAARFYHQATTKADWLASVLDKALSPSAQPQCVPGTQHAATLDQVRQGGRAAAEQLLETQRKAGLNITARPAARSDQVTPRSEDPRTRDDGREL